MVPMYQSHALINGGTEAAVSGGQVHFDVEALQNRAHPANHIGC